MNGSDHQPSRRDAIRIGLTTGLGLAVGRLPLGAQQMERALALLQQPLVTRPVPKTGEQLPVVGVGTNRYGVSTPEDIAARCEVLKKLAELGGKVIDTARGYGRAELVVGQCVQDANLRDKLFIATKYSIGGRGGAADPRAGTEEAFTRLQMQVIDLMMVHNMGGTDALLPVMFELKQAGRFRYVGISISSDRNYAEMATYMRDQPLDFVEVDYSLSNRNSAEQILPIAQERGIAVLINIPFDGRGGSLITQMAGKPLPDWAAEIDCTSWPQILLKYVASHPAVTCVHPGTTRVEHIVDNLGAARGRMPDAAMRTRIEQFYETM
jgi:aryl-alcohol dehydrogenase-like predicted oxidoreductase